MFLITKSQTIHFLFLLPQKFVTYMVLQYSQRQWLLTKRSAKNRLKQRFTFTPHLSYLFYISQTCNPNPPCGHVWGQGWGVLMMNTKLWRVQFINPRPKIMHINDRAYTTRQPYLPLLAILTVDNLRRREVQLLIFQYVFPHALSYQQRLII
jgi:hypothetical protein